MIPAVAAGGLPGAATAFVIDKALGNTLDKISTAHFKVGGTLSDPKINTISASDAEPCTSC